MRNKRTYVVVFPDKQEHFSEIMYHPESFSPKRICEDAVRAKKLTTSRKNPQQVVVDLFWIEIVQGEQKRRSVGTFEVTPLLDTMNSEEYALELNEAVGDLPPEFQDFVKQSSWDRGHSAGFEEVVSIAKDMTFDLRKFVERYQKRIMFELIGK